MRLGVMPPLFLTHDLMNGPIMAQKAHFFRWNLFAGQGRDRKTGASDAKKRSMGRSGFPFLSGSGYGAPDGKFQTETVISRRRLLTRFCPGPYKFDCKEGAVPGANFNGPPSRPLDPCNHRNRCLTQRNLSMRDRSGATWPRDCALDLIVNEPANRTTPDRKCCGWVA